MRNIMFDIQRSVTIFRGNGHSDEAFFANHCAPVRTRIFEVLGNAFFVPKSAKRAVWSLPIDY